MFEIVPSGSPGAEIPTRRQAHRRLRPDEIRELVAGYQAGSTVYELARQFRIHRTTVSDLLKQEGVLLRLAPLSPAQVGRIINLYGEGLSLVNVGTEIGCSPDTVSKVLKDSGVERRDPHGR